MATAGVQQTDAAELPHDHWVSRGYQQNFATTDKRVAVFDVRLGRVVDDRRPIKSNFQERGFTIFLQAGVPQDLLERGFASVESRVPNEIRTISRGRSGPQQKADVASLFDVHLVRSPALKVFHAHITQQYRDGDVPIVASEPSLRERFEAEEGRGPTEGELLDLTLRAYNDLVADSRPLVTFMLRQHDAMAEVLNCFHLQVVEVHAGLPGLVDTPVVHAALSVGHYGFRDRVALATPTSSWDR